MRMALDEMPGFPPAVINDSWPNGVIASQASLSLDASDSGKGEGAGEEGRREKGNQSQKEIWDPLPSITLMDREVSPHPHR